MNKSVINWNQRILFLIKTMTNQNFKTLKSFLCAHYTMLIKKFFWTNFLIQFFDASSDKSCNDAKKKKLYNRCVFGLTLKTLQTHTVRIAIKPNKSSLVKSLSGLSLTNISLTKQSAAIFCQQQKCK